MSEYINKLKSWFKNISKRESSYIKDGVRPKRDWEIILAFSTVALILVASVAAYFYVQVNQGNLFNAASGDTESETKINKALLDKTIADINERKKTFDAIKQGSSVPSDPSI